MQFTAAQIAQLLQGTVEGDANATVSRLSKIEEGGPGSLSFLANPAYTQYVYGSTASVVIIGQGRGTWDRMQLHVGLPTGNTCRTRTHAKIHGANLAACRFI